MGNESGFVTDELQLSPKMSSSEINGQSIRPAIFTVVAGTSCPANCIISKDNLGTVVASPGLRSIRVQCVDSYGNYLQTGGDDLTATFKMEKPGKRISTAGRAAAAEASRTSDSRSNSPSVSGRSSPTSTASPSS